MEQDDPPGPATPPPARRPAVGHGSVGFLLSSLGSATSAGFRDALAPLEIEPQHWAALRAVASNEGKSQREVCGVLHMPPSRMVGLIDELEAKGLVERRTNAQDRRARAIHLTDAGRRRLGDAVARAVDFETWVCEPLEGAERDQLLAILQRLAEHYGLFGNVHPELSGQAVRGPGAGGTRFGPPDHGR